MQTSEMVEYIKSWISDYCKSMPKEPDALVIGISGGIDSSVTSTLCALTGKKTIVLSMPIKQIKEQHNLSLKHQEWLKKKFKNVEDHLINLDLLFFEYSNNFFVPVILVNIASIAGKEGNPNAMPYSAAKAGVIALTKSLGKELADKNIAVNCVTPAAAKTRIFDQISEEHINYMLSKIPRNRFVKVDELASLVSWMASEENSFTTGAVFDLSGGRATY